MSRREAVADLRDATTCALPAQRRRLEACSDARPANEFGLIMPTARDTLSGAHSRLYRSASQAS